MSLSGCQINLIDVNVKRGKNLADKKDRMWKVPCLMPIRVNFSIVETITIDVFRVPKVRSFWYSKKLDKLWVMTC